jgi:hypothetical protein
MFEREQFLFGTFSTNLLRRHVSLPTLPREDRRSENR